MKDKIKTITINNQTIIFIFAIIISIISMMSFSMYFDVKCITTWAWMFLECIRKGELSEYAVKLANAGFGVNYSIPVVAVIAVWMSPLYIYSKVNDIYIGYPIRSGWYKVLLFIAVLICIYAFMRVLRTLGYTKRQYNQILILWLISPLVQWSILAHGQLDVFGVIFFMFGTEQMIKKNYTKMSLLFSAALMTKGIAIIFILPMIVLLFGKELDKLIKNMAILISLPIISSIISEMLIKDYNKYVNEINGAMFLSRIYDLSVQDTSILLITCGAILFVGYYRAVKGMVTKWDYLLLPMAIFMVPVIIFFWHPQWMIYSLGFVLIIGSLFSDKIIFHLLYFLMNVGFLLYVNTNVNWNGLSNDMIADGTVVYVLENIFKMSFKVPIYIGDAIGAYFPYGKETFRSMFVLAMILIVGVGIYELRKLPKDVSIEKLAEENKLLLEDEEKKEQRGLLFVQFLPMIIIIIVSYYYLLV